MLNRAKLFSMMVIFQMILACCNVDPTMALSKPLYYPSPTKVYQRDSLYLATTVWQFMDKGVDVFNYYKQYRIPFRQVRIDVDSIFYSTDSLKLFAFIIETIPEFENKKPKEYFYSGNCMIGFRADKRRPWTIYSFDQFTPTGYKDYNKIRRLFRWYYLGDGKFKNDYDSYWDGIHIDTLGMARSITFPKEENRVNIKFGYNIDDKLFWDSSIVWKKGSRIPGYFAFQTKGNVAPGYMDEPIKIIPPLNYPDSLLKLYK